MNGRSKKVKVMVRIRPTANLALDMLDLQQDGKVTRNTNGFSLLVIKYMFNINV